MTVQEAINKVLDIARNEIGYKEKASNSQLDDKTANAGSGNYTKYARDLDAVTNFYNGKKNGFAYCDIFHDWLHYKAWGADMAMRVLCQPERSSGAGCLYSAQYYQRAGRWHTKNPQPGDQIFFKVGGDISHTGIVEKVVGSEITTIEGNTSDMVARRVYNIANGYIAGYGTPRYELVADVDADSQNTVTDSKPTSTTQTAAYSPIVCMMTQSTCYRGTSKMSIKGVLWHSTGADNPWLKRYVQPDDNAKDREVLLQKLGVNYNHNDWNHIAVQAGLNAWIGKLADGTVATVQTMPWDYKPWGCGGGCNNGWIQFEICEDSLTDPNYFNAVYQEGVRLTAYLCKLYNIDPYGKVNGVPTILCHQDSYKYGMGTNHADVYHWFSRYGKTMDNVRADVAALLKGYTAPNTTTYVAQARDLGRGDSGADVKELQRQLMKLGYALPRYGADGDFGGETDAAVRKFQAANGLKVDGIVGNATKAKINALLGSGQTQQTQAVAQSDYFPAVGDIVNFKGDIHFYSANSAKASSCKGGKAKVTQIYLPQKSKHPYHLVAMPGGGSTVRGWVDAGSFEKV